MTEASSSRSQHRLRTIAAIIALAPIMLLAACVPVGSTASPSPAASASPRGALPVRAGAHAFFLGDSYTEGTSAAAGQGYAYVASRLLGWVPEIDAEGGTGFLNAGRGDGMKKAFPERIDDIPVSSRADVVIVEGGLNDANDPTIDLGRLPDAIRLTVSRLRSRFPRAPIVLLGPEPPTVPAPARVVEVDAVLRSVAAQESLPYISPLAEQWITQDTVASLIDPTTMHPDTAGHAYLAARFVLDLERSGEAVAP